MANSCTSYQLPQAFSSRLETLGREAVANLETLSIKHFIYAKMTFGRVSQHEKSSAAANINHGAAGRKGCKVYFGVAG